MGLLTKIRVYPKPGSAATLIGGKIYGSVNGTTFDLLQTIGSSAQDGWNEFEVEPSKTPTQRAAYR